MSSERGKRRHDVHGRHTVATVDEIDKVRKFDKRRRKGKYSGDPTAAHDILQEETSVYKSRDYIRGIDGSIQTVIGPFPGELIPDIERYVDDIVENGIPQIEEETGLELTFASTTRLGEDGSREFALFVDIGNQRKENPDRAEVANKLEELVLQQQEDNRSKTIIARNISSHPGGILSAFGDNPQIVALADELAFPYRSRQGEQGFASRKRRASSRMLEIIAYEQDLFHQNDAEEGITVLDTQRTLEFYRTRFPNANAVEHEFGLTGIDGITIPDFLIVQNNTIQTVVEVTSHDDLEYFAQKYEAFDRAKKSRRHGELYTGANLAFIVPGDYPRDVATSVVNRFDDTMIGILQNVNMPDINRLIDVLYMDAKDRGDVFGARTA